MKPTKLTFGNLYLVSFMGSFGYFLLIPILLQMVKHGHGISHGLGDWLYAIVLGLMPLSSVLTSPMVGRLSDQWGRKYLIIGACCLNVASFILPVIALHTQVLWWLVAGSMLSGLAANAQPLSQAVIASVSQGCNKARRFGFDAFAMALATILGPLCGHYLSDPRWVSWFTLATPFYVGMFLAGITIVLTAFTCPSSQPGTISIIYPRVVWSAIPDLFKLPSHLRRLVLAYFLVQLGWAVFYQDIGWFYHALGWGDQVANVLAVIGMSAFASLLIIYPILLRYLSHRKLMLLAVVFCIFGVSLLMWPQLWLQWLLVVPVALIYNFYYPSFLTAISDVIPRTEQGWLIACANALMGFAWFLSGFVSTGLHQISIWAGHILVVIIFIMVLLLHCRYRFSEGSG